MASIPTHAELVDIARDELVAGNSAIDPDRVDVEGHPANIIVNVGAAQASDVGHQVVLLERALFLDTCSGTDLDRLVYDRYGITRNGASPSLGTVQISRPTASYGAITITTGTVLHATDGTQFELTEDAVFGGADTGPVSADIRSVLAGAGQRAQTNTITAFESTPADSSLTVTNAEGTAGDADAESDTDLRERARGFFASARRGTLGAIEYGARNTPGIEFAVATEGTLLTGQPARFVRLHIADRLGQSSAALVAAVQTELLGYRPAGMYVQLIGGQITWVDITIALTVASGYDAGVVADQMRAAIVARLDEHAPAQTLFHSDIVSAAKGVGGVADCAVNTPAAALAAADDQVYRTSTARITVVSP